MRIPAGVPSIVAAACLASGCSGGATRQADTSSPPTSTQPAPPPTSASAEPAQSVATAAPAARPEPATPTTAAPRVVAVAGADGHGKTTLLAAVSQSLATRGLGKAQSYEQLNASSGAEISFDSGGRRLTLKEYPSHAALVAALGKPASLEGFVLVVAQAEGIAAQTREQIAAAGKAKLKPLLVVQTKDDWVDDAELKDLEQSEIEQALVEAGLLAEKDAGTWEEGKYKPGTRLPFLRVSAKRALEGDAKAQAAIAQLTTAIEKRAGGTAR